jgi:hypothetical protein
VDIEKQTIEKEAVLNADYIIHRELISLKSHGLISGKRSLLVENSHPTYLLRSKEKSKKLDAYFASAVGIYGAVNEEICTETTVRVTTFGFDLSEMEAA